MDLQYIFDDGVHDSRRLKIFEGGKASRKIEIMPIFSDVLARSI